MTRTTFRYPGGDVEAVGLLALPAGPGPHPGVLVAHEGPGLDVHAKLRAGMLAELGYAALALDLYGGGQVADDHDDVIARVSDLRARRDLLRGRMRAGLKALRGCAEVDADRVAAIGYCFGGMAVLELARDGADVAGVVAFHGLLDADDRYPADMITASILVCTGADDHLVPPDQVAAFQDEMTAAGADWQVVTYGGARHAFTNHVAAEQLAALGFGYDARADRRAWSAMRNFLTELFDA